MLQFGMTQPIIYDPTTESYAEYIETCTQMLRALYVYARRSAMNLFVEGLVAETQHANETAASTIY